MNSGSKTIPMPSKFLTVVGHPIAHSKSPDLHHAAYASLGQDYQYDRVDVEEGGLAGFIESYRPGLSGLSVTMPLKREALAFSDEIDFLARGTDAVNTLVITRDGAGAIEYVSGYNTDVYGIVQSLRDGDVGHVHRAAIVGAGATASSALAALAELGAEHVDVFARNVDKAQSLVGVADVFGTTMRIHSLDALGQVEAVDVAISTLPGTESLSLAELDRVPSAVLLDVAYDPWPSSRAVEWNVAGGSTVSGLRMLAHQAVHQVRLFVQGNAEAPLENEDAMLAAMFEAVGLA